MSESVTVARRQRFWWLRWVLLALVVIVLTVEAILVWPKLEDAWHQIGRLHWEWIIASIAAALLSMDSFAQVQRTLLRSAGVKVKQWKSLAVILAANSVSQTMPGGQVLAPAFTYRQTRKWGATPVVASWQVVMSGLLAGIGLAVLGLGGAIMAGAKTSPFSVIFSIAGFAALIAVLQYLATHPESLQATGTKALGWFNQIRNKPVDAGSDKLFEMIDQLRAVQLNKRDAGVSFGWSLFNWVADVACLAFACWAVGVHPSIAGLMVAYAAGKAVGSAVPLLPGGIGVVDAVLVPALTSAGMPAADALTAVLVYRVISYVLIAVIGWVVILVMFRDKIRDGDDVDAVADVDPDRRADQLQGADDHADGPPGVDPGSHLSEPRSQGPRSQGPRAQRPRSQEPGSPELGDPEPDGERRNFGSPPDAIT